MASADPIVVLLGSNIAPERHLREALRRMGTRVGVREVSAFYATAPVSAWPNAPGFLNAAALVETDLTPERLKSDVLRAIEAELGRVRIPGDKTAPRVIDLDLALYGDRVAAGDLELPEPALLTAAYAAVPVAELVPDWRHPVDGRRLAEIAAGLDASGVRKACRAGT
jgi:2-amino-4-hydroxy-6-hydroxymethyldihydropteridine diphosphokinase